MKKSISVLRKEFQIKNFILIIIINELINVNIYNLIVIDVVFLIDLSYVKVFLVFSLKENDGLDVVKNVLGYIRKMFLKILN